MMAFYLNRDLNFNLMCLCPRKIVKRKAIILNVKVGGNGH